MGEVNHILDVEGVEDTHSMWQKAIAQLVALVDPEG